MLQVKGPRVLLTLDEVPETTAAGIILSSESVDKPQTGVIVAVGTGRILNDGSNLPVQVKVGERVLFSKYSGTPITYDGESFMLIQETDIHVVIE